MRWPRGTSLRTVSGVRPESRALPKAQRRPEEACVQVWGGGDTGRLDGHRKDREIRSKQGPNPTEADGHGQVGEVWAGQAGVATAGQARGDGPEIPAPEVATRVGRRGEKQRLAQV